MKKFIEENWFKIGLLLLLIFAVFIYYKNNHVSITEKYRLNKDCAQEVAAYAKRQTDNWDTIQNIYHVEDGVCYAEFWSQNPRIYHIYNLTNNKAIISVGDFSKAEDFDRYDVIKREIFGEYDAR
jgi:hypothetical protein